MPIVPQDTDVVKPIDHLVERLFTDEQFKDVDIAFSDGVLRAHASVLSAGSDAVRGMVTHGQALRTKKLSWEECDSRVGHFFLRLLYTGHASEEDWQKDEEKREHTQGTDKVHHCSSQPPLPLLLGSLSIAHKYQFSHVSHQLITNVKKRVNAESFDEICKFGINHDIQAVRSHCFMFAASGCSTSGPWFPGRYRVIEPGGIALMESFDITDADSEDDSELEFGAEILVVEVVGQRARVVDPMLGWVSLISTGQCRLLEFCDAVRIKEMYEAERLSPEVCHELRGLWTDDSSAKRKRKRVVI